MKRQKAAGKFVIGVTGVYGSGKSTVAGIFASFGADLVDADRIGHRLLKKGSAVHKKLLASFGRSILGRNGAIERRKLAVLVFSDRKKLKRLNAVTHKEICSVIASRIKSSKDRVVVVDAPLLFEAGLNKSMDRVVVVCATQEQRIKRLKAKGILKEEVLKRSHSQIPLESKKRFADFVIDNNASKACTRKQIEQIRRKWWKNWTSGK